MREAFKSAARNEVEELAACQTTQEVAEKVKVGKFLAIVVCILLHIFFGGVFGPPLGPLQEACAFRRADPKSACRPS